MSTQPRPTFNVALMVEDMTVKGWLTNELARRAGVADMTAYRFFSGEAQTAKTAHKLAKALGYSVRRYLVPATKGRAA